MSTPTITRVESTDLLVAVDALLPVQGSLEVQHDGRGKTHDWHRHSVDEQLHVLRGEVELFWHHDGEVHREICPAGTMILLPAGTVHGSTAGPSGSVYLIAPVGGATPVTTFLPRDQHPAT